MTRWPPLLALALSLGLGAQALAAPESQPAAPADGSAGHDHAAESKTLWTCSMHPQILQEEPGTCPICGMTLVPKTTAPPGASSAGLIRIDPVVVQNMGVRLARVRRAPLSRSVRTIGTVELPEDRLSVVNLRFSGWIERLYVEETGIQVKKGERLFDIYSPELLSVQQEYLVALRTGGRESPLAVSAARRLRLFGLSGGHIKRLARTHKPAITLTIRAPQSGWVVHKKVVEGARVNAGTDLFRIVDLSRVWVEAEVYESDAPWIKLGAAATVDLSFEAGHPRDAVVSFIYPTLNPRTRTLRVRLELDNPGLLLKPGAFATVKIQARAKADVLVLPTEAIIHSGEREVVFIATSLGHYTLREVKTGLVGDRYETEVISGLKEGERIVTSGQFLLDSESQMQEAVAKMLASRLQSNDPDAKGASGSKAADGEADWTCPMHPQISEPEAGPCPICGMDLIERR